MRFSLPDLPPAEAQLFPEGRMAGPMPWVIAVMIFLTVLAAAMGIALSRGAAGLDADLAGRVTLQLVEANPIRRAKQADALERYLAGQDGVRSFQRVSTAEVTALLEPWFGKAGLDADLPVPMMIDVVLDPTKPQTLPRLRRAVADLAPSARLEPHGQWLGPLVGVMGSLVWLAGLLVLLMAAACCAIIVLAARSALNTHRATIEVMHLLGASDPQIARLFQRRLGLDALFGASLGLFAGSLAILLLGYRFTAMGSELLGSLGLGAIGWLALLALPLATALLAMLAARLTVLAALRHML